MLTSTVLSPPYLDTTSCSSSSSITSSYSTYCMLPNLLEYMYYESYTS